MYYTLMNLYESYLKIFLLIVYYTPTNLKQALSESHPVCSAPVFIHAYLL